MKNKIIYAIGWVLLLIVSGCSDWLSVSPRTEKPTEQLFETQNGFRDALTGAYIEMMSDKSYGEYLTMSKIEYLVDFWDPEKGSIDPPPLFRRSGSDDDRCLVRTTI